MYFYGNQTGIPRYSTPKPLNQGYNIFPEFNNINYHHTDDFNQNYQYNQYDPYNQGQQTHENYHKNIYNVNQYGKEKKRNKVNNINYGNYDGNNYNVNYQNNNNYNNYDRRRQYLDYYYSSGNGNNWENLGSDNSSNYNKYETNITFDKCGRMRVCRGVKKKTSQTNINENSWKGNTSNKNQKQSANMKYNYFDVNNQKYLDKNYNINIPNSNHDIDIDALLNTNTNNNNMEIATVKNVSNDTNINYENLFSNQTDNKEQIFPNSNIPNNTTNQINYNIDNAGYPPSNQNDIAKQIDNIVGNPGYPSNQSDYTNNQNPGYSSKQENKTNNNNIDNNTENGGFSSKPNEPTNNNNTTVNQKNNTITTNNNNPTTNMQMPLSPPYVLNNTYYFNRTGLYNIGSTCYMNSTLQCLLHVSPLAEYFIEVYSKQKHCEKLLIINDSAPTKGKISKAFYGIIKSIAQKNIERVNNPMKPKTNIYGKSNSMSEAVSPDIFQKTVGTFNPQFRNLEANDSKDLILYLLQAMHQELNYWTNNPSFNGYPNQYNRVNTFQAFICSYDATNKSIISDLFYGTSENTTKCEVCNNIIYNFQKIEFLTFGVCKYNQKDFNLYNGFDDYIKIDKLTGDNQYYCNNCKKLCDAQIKTTILIPPAYLLINIDYGKNKIYMPSSINYDEEIDISKYVSLNVGKSNKYKIIGICSHLGDSGMYGHYVAYCKNNKDKKWYEFNDSFVSETNSNKIKYTGGTPYLLLYERIDQKIN